MRARWLTVEQQRAWRAYLLGTTLLTERLDRDLRENHGLSLSEYELLVRLSESPDHALRMAELADSVKNSRSRITHTVQRLQDQGFVVRRSCESDGRGVIAVLTDDGLAKLATAAPDHVESVRTALIDGLSPEDVVVLQRVFAGIADRLGNPQQARCVEGLAGAGTVGGLS